MITPAHQRYLRRLVRDHPDLTLEKLRDAADPGCTIQAVHYALLRMNLSLRRRTAIKAAGAEVRFLPPWSPDLNPFENMWSKVKAHLRKSNARNPKELYEAIGRTIATVSPQDIQNWFVSCSYRFI